MWSRQPCIRSKILFSWQEMELWRIPLCTTVTCDIPLVKTRTNNECSIERFDQGNMMNSISGRSRTCGRFYKIHSIGRGVG